MNIFMRFNIAPVIAEKPGYGAIPFIDLAKFAEQLANEPMTQAIFQSEGL